jgi:hypothetical protein
MTEITNLLIGVVVLALGFPLGIYLARITSDESKEGQKWFKLITIIGLAGALISLILGNDILLFSFAFIAIVTSRSLKKV